MVHGRDRRSALAWSKATARPPAIVVLGRFIVRGRLAGDRVMVASCPRRSGPNCPQNGRCGSAEQTNGSNQVMP